MQPQGSTSDRQHPARVPIRHREIIIHNLYREITESMLKDYLTVQIGQVQRCIIRRRDDRRSHAFVTFAQPEQAEMAVEKLDGTELSGREITVRLTKEGETGPLIVNGSDG